MTNVAVIGIDIGKATFHLVAVDPSGAIQWKKFSRSQLMRHMDGMAQLSVGVEACCGAHHLAREMPLLFTDDRSTLLPRMRVILQQLWDEWCSLEADIAAVTKEVEMIAAADEGCRRLLAIPGVEPLVARALVAAVADGTGFKRGCDLAAWLGLVPRQHSTGGKSTLLGMSKRGHGPWLNQLEMRAHKNVAVVALANKIVRCWPGRRSIDRPCRSPPDGKRRTKKSAAR